MADLGALRTPNRRPRIGGISCASISPEKPHPLDPIAAAATILNDIVAFGVRSTLLNAHCFFADNAAEKIDQWASVVVQVTSLARCLRHFPPSARSQSTDGFATAATQGTGRFIRSPSQGYY
jgi:hypothetical protein